jgi:type IV secretory pathway TrbF-like protein
MMVITLVLAFGMVWLSARSRFVPYVVEVDKLGYAIGAPARSLRTPRASVLIGWCGTSWRRSFATLAR